MRLAEKKKLQLPSNGLLGGKDVPYVIVGDEAFPLKPWLMRPFPGSGLSLEKATFNYRLSRARRVVENTFGIWAAKWRILFTPIDGDDDLINMIIWSTLILHNFLRVKHPTLVEGEDGSSSRMGQNIGDIPRVATNNYSNVATNIRQIFTEFFSSPEGELPWQFSHVTRST